MDDNVFFECVSKETDLLILLFLGLYKANFILVLPISTNKIIL